VTLTVRTANEQDLTALRGIEDESFSWPRWRAEDFLKYRCTVAECGRELAGFMVVRDTFRGGPFTSPEREILNLAVASRFRRLGVATQLLQAEIHSGAVYTLEVRESNVAAQTLYRKLGFIEIGRRKKYYSNPPETAIVMQVK
jgi:[ribosomal protein S18]-alanine N-acetyltransferase